MCVGVSCVRGCKLCAWVYAMCVGVASRGGASRGSHIVAGVRTAVHQTVIKPVPFEPVETLVTVPRC